MKEYLEALEKMSLALEAVRKAKPGDRSNTDRDHQIVITDLEKLIAFYEHRVIEGKQ